MLVPMSKVKEEILQCTIEAHKKTILENKDSKSFFHQRY